MYNNYDYSSQPEHNSPAAKQEPSGEAAKITLGNLYFDTFAGDQSKDKYQGFETDKGQSRLPEEERP